MQRISRDNSGPMLVVVFQCCGHIVTRRFLASRFVIIFRNETYLVRITREVEAASFSSVEATTVFVADVFLQAPGNFKLFIGYLHFSRKCFVTINEDI